MSAVLVPKSPAESLICLRNWTEYPALGAQSDYEVTSEKGKRVTRKFIAEESRSVSLLARQTTADDAIRDYFLDITGAE